MALKRNRRLHLNELAINGVYLDNVQTPYTQGSFGADLSLVITSADVDLSDKQVSELSIKVFDPNHKMLLSHGVQGYFPLDAEVVWTPSPSTAHRFLITARESSGPNETTITCRAKVSTQLRRLRGPLGYKNLSPLQALSALTGNTVKILGEQTASLPDLSVGDGFGDQVPESGWAAAVRWVGEEGERLGFILMEDGGMGTLYYGRISWLRDRTPRITINWTTNPLDLDDGVLGPPVGRETLDADGESTSLKDKKDPIERTVSLRVHIDLGKKLRPGMMVDMNGEGPWVGQSYWINSVSGPLEDGSEWVVEMTTPAKDPVYDSFGITPTTPGSTEPNGWYTMEDIAALLRYVGWPESSLVKAIAITWAESRGNPNARNDKGNEPAGSVDRGLFQFNDYWHKNLTDKDAYNPEAAARYFLQVTKNGRDFTQWATNNPTKSGGPAPYKAFVPQATIAAGRAAIPVARPRSGSGFGASAGHGDQGDELVWLGIGSHRLQPAAADAWKSASDAYGATIEITDSYRTYAQQVQVKKDKPTLAATPGKSLHERGLAIDVKTPRSNALVSALTRAGWRQFNPSKEPWHWSYGSRVG